MNPVTGTERTRESQERGEEVTGRAGETSETGGMEEKTGTVLQANSDSDVMFCLQIYQALRIDRSLVY